MLNRMFKSRKLKLDNRKMEMYDFDWFDCVVGMPWKSNELQMNRNRKYFGVAVDLEVISISTGLFGIESRKFMLGVEIEINCFWERKSLN